MYVLQVRDKRARHLTFDLAELLDALGPRARTSSWSCDVDELLGKKYEREGDLYRGLAADMIPGEGLCELAAEIRQTIDGVFRGRDSGDPEVWIELRAIDSSFWEVRTSSPEAVAAIRAKFRAVSPTTPDAA